MDQQKALVEYCLRQGDNALILGQRLSEWTGHGPVLEEDIAMSNMALDLIGQATGFLNYAAAILKDGRTADDLAFLRDERQFRNRQLCEQPNGDFAKTMLRSFFFSAMSWHLFRELTASVDQTLAGLAEKSLKEMTYHVRHSSEWIIRFGQGTEESKCRLNQALNELWPYTKELFEVDEVDALLYREKWAPDLSVLYPAWLKMVQEVFSDAGILVPGEEGYQASGGIRGLHTEHMGHLLAEMQYLPRMHPGAKW